MGTTIIKRDTNPETETREKKAETETIETKAETEIREAKGETELVTQTGKKLIAGLPSKEVDYCNISAEERQLISRKPLCDSSYSNDASCPKDISFYTHANIDFVSQAGGGWEEGLVKHALSLLFELNQTMKYSPIFMDIGANIGIFTFHVAARGFKVISFEPMKKNRLTLYSTLCENNIFKENVNLQEVGLGNTTNSCRIWSHHTNIGNGQVECDQSIPCEGCVLREEIRVDTLNNVFESFDFEKHKIGVVKIDAEGLEPLIMKGGTKLFGSNLIPYILIELSSFFLPQRSNVQPLDFVNMLRSWGYEFYYLTRQGQPINTPDDFQKLISIPQTQIFLFNQNALNKLTGLNTL